MSDTLSGGQFLGDPGRARAARGVTLVESSYAGGSRLPSHAHDHAFFCLVLDGAFTERVGSDVHDCVPGSVIFYPAGDTHALRFEASGARCLNVDLEAAWLAGLSDDGCGGLDHPTEARTGPLPGLALRLHRELRLEEASSELAVEGLVLAMLGELSRPPRRGRPAAPWLRRAEELLRERFRETLTLDVVAGHLGVHPVRLARGFRRYHGRSLGEFVRELRVDAARRALLSGERPLASVALEAGFADQSHFTRVFRRHTGQTPGAFRRAHAPP